MYKFCSKVIVYKPIIIILDYNGDMIEVCTPRLSRAAAARSIKKRFVCGGWCIFAIGMAAGVYLNKN